MTKGRKNDFERIEGGQIVRVRNMNVGKIKFTMKIRMGREAKWSKTRKWYNVRFEIKNIHKI